ncbi:UNVERIFIED_CONTAM: hypothetical protein GTU68_049394 [Idotea baltica]|nr:hypothetical protein [Idotea baltica]
MARNAVVTKNAPGAIGAYSQAIKCGPTVYLSGQIPLDPETMEVVSDDPREQIVQVFKNLKALCEASGGSFSDVVKLTVFLPDLGHFPLVNEVMAEEFDEPYPARAAIGVRSLPKDVAVEVEGIMYIEP